MNILIIVFLYWKSDRPITAYLSNQQKVTQKKKESLVSVIIPTYNRASLLPRAIKSVLGQTYKNIELVIVDDCSTDDTRRIVQSLSKNDRRIKYFFHEKNRGGSAARNTGIKMASGEYVAFQDSDDKWIHDKLEKQMEIFNSSLDKRIIVYTSFLRIEKGKVLYFPYCRNVKKKNGMLFNELLRGNFIDFPTILLKKECLESVGLLDESFPRNQDWELFLRLSKAYPFKFVDEPLVLSFETPGSISSKPELFIKARKLILKKYESDIKKNKVVWSKHEHDLGIHELKYGNKVGGIIRLFKAKILMVFSKIT